MVGEVNCLKKSRRGMCRVTRPLKTTVNRNASVATSFLRRVVLECGRVWRRDTRESIGDLLKLS